MKHADDAHLLGPPAWALRKATNVHGDLGCEVCRYRGECSHARGWAHALSHTARQEREWCASICDTEARSGTTPLSPPGRVATAEALAHRIRQMRGDHG